MKKQAMLITLCIFGVLITGCGGGGGGGGSGTGASNDPGDSSFFVEEVYFGRPLFDPNNHVIPPLINPQSIIETDPITGIILEGFPKPLYPGDPMGQLDTLGLSNLPNSNFQIKIVPRNGALTIDFSLAVDPACMKLDNAMHLTPSSPVQILTEHGDPVPVQVMVWGDQVILNPVTAGKVGFPASPLAFDLDGNPMANPHGYLKLIIYSSMTGPHVVKSADGRLLSARKDLFGTPLKPIGFNPGNAMLDFIQYGDLTFNGFLPDLSPPRILREVRHEGTAGAGSDAFNLVDGDPAEIFNTAANKGYGEWAGGLLTLRPGTLNEEKVKVVSNTEEMLTVSGGFLTPPQEGDAYFLQRAEFFEPIPGLADLTTAVDPVTFPKDPFDPEDAKNSDLYHFTFFYEWNPATGEWEPADYDPGSGGTNPINTNWRISLRFSEPMDVDSFRPFESYYVMNALVDITEPGFDDMKLGRVTGSDRNRVISFEPVYEDQYDQAGDQLIGFGGTPKSLRLVVRAVPPPSVLEDFYASFGGSLPEGVEKDLDLIGVQGVLSLGGRTLGLPSQYFDKGSPHCVAYASSSGHGVFPPAVDFRYEFSVNSDVTPEGGALVHRFMGRPDPGVGGHPIQSGVVFNDHLPLDPDDPEEMGKVLYGPKIADIAIGVNGFLSGHPVEFIEHVFDSENSPGPTSPTYPDPITKIPFGVGTPVTASHGCRFQHIYRKGDCSPDVSVFQHTYLDLIGLSWAPIGGWVTNTVLEEMSVLLCLSQRNPNTKQSAGIPNNGGSGLLKPFDNNIATTQVPVVGTKKDGVPYIIDWHNLFAPQNAGQKFYYYHPMPVFDKPEEAPGFQYDSTKSLLIEYRLDPNIKSSAAVSNGFTFCAGILSSVLPRFRIYSRGSPTSLIYGCSRPKEYPLATGPLASPASYGDNSRYFMIFHYVKRWSRIDSPFLGRPVDPGYDLQFMNPIFDPPLTALPEGTSLEIQFQVATQPNGSGAESDWRGPDIVQSFNTHGTYKLFNYIRFSAVFKANSDTETVPALDAVIIPYRIVKE